MGSVGDAFRVAEDVGHLLRAGCTLTCCGARRGFQYANFYTDLISVRKFNHSCCFFVDSPAIPSGNSPFRLCFVHSYFLSKHFFHEYVVHTIPECLHKSGSCLHISRSCEDNFQTTIVDMFFARIYPQFVSQKKYSPIHT